MKIQVIYASRTGCTRRLAQAIYEGLPGEEKSIHDLSEGIPALTGDILLLGYWGISGGPDPETAAFLNTVRKKAVGIFCTLGYYADSSHGFDTMRRGIDLLRDRNEILGGYVCNGAVASQLKEDQGKDDGAVPTEQKELRWEMISTHPTPAECALAAERFRERIALYEKARKLEIPFQSIL